MAYIINKFNGTQLIVLQDGTIDTSTSLGLVGRNYVGYGETQNENFVYLLENFANDSPPARPIAGQIWFDTTTNIANVYNGTAWGPVGAAKLSSTAPADPNAGYIWLDTTANQLKIWTGAEWGFIGPEAVAGFGVTRARSVALDDSNGNPQPVIFLEADDTVIAICTSSDFTINPSSSIAGFTNNLTTGINLSSTAKLKGDVTGNATSADRLSTARFINNAPFDGQTNITIKASTTNKLVKGTYISGSDFDGSSETTWSVDATSSNVIGKVVARNSEGGFSAGTITATFVGDLTGNVTASTGTSTFNTVRATTFIGATLTGNANSATQLATSRKINGVNFNGTDDITVSAAAGTLTGTQLSPTVTDSSLTTLGTLANLSVADSGISIGGSSQLRFFVDSSTPTIRSQTGSLNFDMGSLGPDISFVNAATALSMGGLSAPSIVGDNTTNLGIIGHTFDKVYANTFIGNANTATLATTATNLAGGGAGAIPYQTFAGTTAMLGLGTAGYVLKAQAGGIGWEAFNSEQLNKGSYINLINTTTSGAVDYFNSSFPATISVNAATSGTSNIVARDGSGNFSAGTITASLNGTVKGNITSTNTSGVVLNTSLATAVFTGNVTGDVTGTVSGNAGSATRLATPRNINGVAFDGTANITISANDPTKVSLAGDTMTGYLTLVANPTVNLHAATKQYVDNAVGALDQLATKVSISGDTMTGYLTLAANPTNNLHAATKQYVDANATYTFSYGFSYSTSSYTNQVGSFNDGANYFDVFPPAGKSMDSLVAFIPSIAIIHYAGGVNADDSMRCYPSYYGDRIRVYVQNTEQRSTPAANYLAIWR
jgi:hypothetical protein